MWEFDFSSSSGVFTTAARVPRKNNYLFVRGP